MVLHVVLGLSQLGGITVTQRKCHLLRGRRLLRRCFQVSCPDRFNMLHDRGRTHSIHHHCLTGRAQQTQHHLDVALDKQLASLTFFNKAVFDLVAALDQYIVYRALHPADEARLVTLRLEVEHAVNQRFNVAGEHSHHLFDGAVISVQEFSTGLGHVH